MTAPLWTPGPERRQACRLQAFLDAKGAAGYDELWQWSVSDPGFWTEVAQWLSLPLRRQPDHPQRPAPDRVAGVEWFPGALLNYAEAALSAGGSVLGLSDTRPPVEFDATALRRLVARYRSGLANAGVRKGDSVVAYLPNIPETLAMMLATASLGATWACCAPEVGVAGALDRLGQLQPKVLVAVDGYRYGAKEIDRREEAERIREGLPSLEVAVWLPYLQTFSEPPTGWRSLEGFGTTGADLEFEAVTFDHPLYVLFSSGTTGKPKAIIHGHGGIALEHAKALAFHFDLSPGERFFWYSTTGWMMWNFLVSGLLVGATVVLYDGAPTDLWRVMADAEVTCGGVGAGYLVQCAKTSGRPEVPSLVTLGATGSPLPAAAAEWVYRTVSGDLLLASFSGGTDVCTGFVGASPLHPVWAGEISCRCLGAAVEVFDDDGRPLIGAEGELVLTRPMPSMPVGFVGDPDGRRYRDAYWARFEGVWAHGDRATLTERGTMVITGRSDGTLNRGGVRMGTAEFYAIVEAFPDVADSLVVHLEDPDGGPGRLMLFVVADEADLDAGLRDRLAAALRRDLSPRHVPDSIEAVPAVPRTLSGKKLEVPVKRILSGADPDRAVTRASVADPFALDWFVNRYRRS